MAFGQTVFFFALHYEMLGATNKQVLDPFQSENQPVPSRCFRKGAFHDAVVSSSFGPSGHEDLRDESTNNWEIPRESREKHKRYHVGITLRVATQ